MRAKPDLTKAGGRLKHSIELLSLKSIQEFAEENSESIGMSWRNLYAMAKKDELEYQDIQPIQNVLRDIDFDYVLKGDRSKSPEKVIANRTELKSNKDVQDLARNVEYLEQIRKLQTDKIEKLENEKIELQQEIAMLRQKYSDYK